MNAQPIFMRRPAVLAAVGVSAATLQRMVARGEFPKPRRLSAEGRAVAWLRTDVERWAESLPESNVLPVGVAN